MVIDPNSTKAAEETPAATRRRAARLAAMQALYQIEVMSDEVESTIFEFLHQRRGLTLESEGVMAMDNDFFADLVRGAVRRQREIDDLVVRALSEGWRLERLESVLRGILRCGVYELLLRVDVPAKVVINEYVEVTDAFFAEDQKKFVNAILDRIAHRLRPGELPDTGNEQSSETG